VIEDRDSPPPYQGESRSRSSNHSSKRHHTASGSVWSLKPHKCCLSLVLDWLRTVAVQWLSAMLIVDIKCTDQSPTDLVKSSQSQRCRASQMPLRAGCMPLQGRCNAGYYGQGQAHTGAQPGTRHGGYRAQANTI